MEGTFEEREEGGHDCCEEGVGSGVGSGEWGAGSGVGGVEMWGGVEGLGVVWLGRMSVNACGGTSWANALLYSYAKMTKGLPAE